MQPTRPSPDELKARSRRIFFWSMVAAGAVHIVVIAFSSWRASIADARPPEVAQPSATQWTGAPVDIFFGPPRIFLPDETLAEEPPTRILEAARSIHTPSACSSREARSTTSVGSGVARLTVNESGRIDLASVAQSTGDQCWDAVALRVVKDLRYEWLPSERFPAPVEVLQPMTVAWVFD